MRRRTGIYRAHFKLSCDTCPRCLKYKGAGLSKKEAEDNAINSAFKVGWIMVGNNLHCPACVKAGRAEEPEETEKES